MLFSRKTIANIRLYVTCMFIYVYVAQGKNVEKDILTNINSKLKALHRPALKSIQSSDGDIIDCIDIYKQPALDHPLLKNHTIQMSPGYTSAQAAVDDMNKSSSSTMLQQIWQKSGNCPGGTIPIRRVRKQDLLRYDNLESFGRKSPQVSGGSRRQVDVNRTLVINNSAVTLGPEPHHSYAMLVATVFHYIGSKGTLNLWNPRVASPDEYTTSQIWLVGGGPKDYESVEAGWMVNPKLYGDTQTRFFIYWTNDGSQKTGCFDLLCSGFVQTSKAVALGAAISPLSSEGGDQYTITVQITRDDKTGNWWLRVNDNFDFGYWPGSLFGAYLRSGAMLAQWGGYVYSPNVGKSPHTTTALGSGNFPEDLFGYASYIAHIRVQYPSVTWTYPQYVGLYVDEKNCYGAFHYVPGFMDEPTLFFGGPGQNPRCP